jgi:hypothetical protein
MKVKDLIKQLEQYKPETEVYFSNSLDCFRSASGCSYEGCLDISLENKENVDEVREFLEESGSEYDLPELEEGEEIVVLTISGEENWNQ